MPRRFPTDILPKGTRRERKSTVREECAWCRKCMTALDFHVALQSRPSTSTSINKGMGTQSKTQYDQRWHDIWQKGVQLGEVYMPSFAAPAMFRSISWKTAPSIFQASEGALRNGMFPHGTWSRSGTKFASSFIFTRRLACLSLFQITLIILYYAEMGYRQSCTSIYRFLWFWCATNSWQGGIYTRLWVRLFFLRRKNDGVRLRHRCLALEVFCWKMTRCKSWPSMTPGNLNDRAWSLSFARSFVLVITKLFVSGGDTK